MDSPNRQAMKPTHITPVQHAPIEGTPIEHVPTPVQHAPIQSAPITPIQRAPTGHAPITGSPIGPPIFREHITPVEHVPVEHIPVEHVPVEHITPVQHTSTITPVHTSTGHIIIKTPIAPPISKTPITPVQHAPIVGGTPIAYLPRGGLTHIQGGIIITPRRSILSSNALSELRKEAEKKNVTQHGITLSVVDVLRGGGSNNNPGINQAIKTAEGALSEVPSLTKLSQEVQKTINQALSAGMAIPSQLTPYPPINYRQLQAPYRASLRQGRRMRNYSAPQATPH